MAIDDTLDIQLPYYELFQKSLLTVLPFICLSILMKHDNKTLQLFYNKFYLIFDYVNKLQAYYNV